MQAICRMAKTTRPYYIAQGTILKYNGKEHEKECMSMDN